jgi:hypothetical protein
MQIQDHDIAIARGTEQIDAILIRLQQNLEFLPKGGRKQRLERMVFRIKSDLDHAWTRSLAFTAAPSPWGGAETS